MPMLYKYDSFWPYFFFLIILGERVSHLDKTDVYNAPQDQEEKEKREQGDDYVLSRLV